MEESSTALVPAHKQGATKNASGRSGGCRHRVVGLLTNALLANEPGCVVSPLAIRKAIVRTHVVPFSHTFYATPTFAVKNCYPIFSTTTARRLTTPKVGVVGDTLVTPLEQALGLYVIKADVAVVKLCIAMRVIARSRALLYDQLILRLTVDAGEIFIVRLAVLARRRLLQLEVNADKPSSRLDLNFHDLIVLPNHDVRTIDNDRDMSPLWNGVPQ